MIPKFVRMVMGLWKNRLSDLAASAAPRRKELEEALDKSIDKLRDSVEAEKKAMDNVVTKREEELGAHEDLRSSVGELLRRLEEEENADKSS